MADEGSVIGFYGAKLEYGQKSAQEIMDAIERVEFAELSCMEVLGFKVSAEELAAGIADLVAHNEQFYKDLEREHAAGAKVLRVAPTSGTHVRLFDLEELLAQA